jgi:hypothetical protein
MYLNENLRPPDLNMAALPVLTSLCPICFVSPPKYCCPRCSMRTCSLKCSQDHKVRASCSGVRDPAKYIAKRDMKSSTVDMDFNFLQSIHKSRAEARDQLNKLERGDLGSSRRKLDLGKRKTAFSKANERGFNVRSLPKHFEKFNLNKTTWDSKYLSWCMELMFRTQCVLWTLEWLVSLDKPTATHLTRLDHR